MFRSATLLPRWAISTATDTQAARAGAICSGRVCLLRVRWHALLVLVLLCLCRMPPAFAVELPSLDARQPLGQHAWIQAQTLEASAEWLAAPGPWLELRAATLGEAPLPELLPGQEADSWRRNERDRLLLNAPGRLSWVVLDLRYTGPAVQDAVLDLSGLDGVAWQYLDHEGRLQRHADDFSAVRGGRPYFDTNAVLPMQLVPGHSYRVHLAAFTVTAGKHVTFTLWNADAFRAQRLAQQLFDGVYFGLVCALLLYSLFLGVAMRQYTYLFFALFIASSAGLIYLGSGLSPAFGLHNSLSSTLGLTFLFQGLVGVCGGLFSIALLNIRETNRRLFQLWLAVLALTLLATPSVMYLARAGGYSTDDISSTFAVVILVWLCNQLVNFVTLWHYRHHSRLVLYWFMAVTLHTWVLAFWPLLLNSSINIPFAPYHLAQLATLVDTLLMATLIAHDLRSEHNSRLKAQQSAVENLRLAHDIERAKSNFVATVGHDLRSPVQAISHFTQSLKLQVDTGQRANLDKIDENLVMISDLLDGMVKLSQTEWQGLKPKQVEVPLGHLLQELHSEFAALAEKRGLQLDCDDTRASVGSDRVCLSQILRNLIDNALKFTTSGGVRIKVSTTGDSVVLRIEDSGCGIPESALPHIFDEFYQVPGSGDRAGGVGLGLSIVARLARLLDIQLKVESTPGVGSSFELVIPRARVQDEAAAPAVSTLPEERRPGSLQGLRVLVLTGNDSSPDTLADLLQRWGAKLQVLDSPHTLLVHFREELLLCDLLLAEQASFTHLLAHLGADDRDLLLQCTAPCFISYPAGEAAAPARVDHPHVAVAANISAMQFRSLVQRNLNRSAAAEA